MVLTDGTTTVTLDPSNDAINPEIEESTKRTAGGNVRHIVGGERFNVTSTVRATPAQYRSLIDLLNNNADNYFFTPAESTESWWADLYPSISFPLNCVVTDINRDWDNRGYWWVKMKVKSTSYV